MLKSWMPKPQPLALAAGLTVLALEGLSAGELECQDVRSRLAEIGSAIEDRQLVAALFEAAEKGCVDIAREVLDKGADIRTRRRGGETALHHAARGVSPEMIAFLLDRGAAIEARDLKGSTPLFLAAENNRKAVVKLLVERGAKVNAPGRSGTTPLAAAAFNGNISIVELLLEKGADPGLGDNTGKPPIVYAAARGFHSIVEKLLAKGIDINAKYEHDLTLLMWAAGHTNDVPEEEGRALVAMLLERGAKQDERDDRGKTALLIAAELGHAAAVQELIKHGAAQDIKDKEGKSAADVAANDAVKAALGTP